MVVKDGKIANVFTHLSEMPENGVLHLIVDSVETFDEFKESHPKDEKELEGNEGKIVISSY